MLQTHFLDKLLFRFNYTILYLNFNYCFIIVLSRNATNAFLRQAIISYLIILYYTILKFYLLLHNTL